MFDMFAMLAMFEKVFAGLYAPPWDAAIKEWERGLALPGVPARDRAAALSQSARATRRSRRYALAAEITEA